MPTIKKNFILYNDKKSKQEYQNLLILIFSILLIIYIYFAYSSYEDIKELKYYNTYNDDFVESQNQNYKLKKNYKRIHRVPYILYIPFLIVSLIFNNLFIASSLKSLSINTATLPLKIILKNKTK